MESVERLASSASTVIVYVPATGVPESTPVEVFNARPVPELPETDHSNGVVPPVAVGVHEYANPAVHEVLHAEIEIVNAGFTVKV